MVSIGDAFPGGTLPALGGGEGSLAPAADLTLVVFGHVDCGTTKLALPVVDRLATGRGDEARVLCVLQEHAAAADRLVGELALGLPVLLDVAPHRLSAALGLVTVPTLVAYAADGVVTNVLEGYSREDLQALAAPIGMATPLFEDDTGPAFRPG